MPPEAWLAWLQLPAGSPLQLGRSICLRLLLLFPFPLQCNQGLSEADEAWSALDWTKIAKFQAIQAALLRPRWSNEAVLDISVIRGLMSETGWSPAGMMPLSHAHLRQTERLVAWGRGNSGAGGVRPPVTLHSHMNPNGPLSQ